MEVLEPLKIWSRTKDTVWRINIDYLCKFLGGNIKLSKEHDDYIWVSFDKLDNMKIEKEATKKVNSK